MLLLLRGLCLGSFERVCAGLTKLIGLACVIAAFPTICPRMFLCFRLGGAEKALQHPRSGGTDRRNADTLSI